MANLRKRRPLLAAFVAFALFAVRSLAFADAFDSRAMVLPVDPEPLIIATDAGPVRISVEIADEQREHVKGLMFRPPLALGRGMLFVMDYEEEQYFWMKNTPSPLDLVFAAKDGTIVSIKQGAALSEASILSDKPAKYVLELARGEAARLGLAPGNRMRHRVIP